MNCAERKKILIIEDSKATALLLKDLLLDERKYNVNLATTGEDAFKKIDNNHYELILLDLILPDTNGKDILKKIRKTKSLAELPIIVVSADIKGESINTCLEIGANDFIEKPFNKLALKTKVNNLISLQEINEKLKEQSKATNQALKKLKESEEHCRFMSNLTFEGILIHDRGTAIEMNNSFAKLFGYYKEELIGKNIQHHIIYNEDIDILAKRINENYENPYQVRAKHKNGKIINIQIQAKSTTYLGKQVRVAIVNDITWRMRVEKKTKRQNKELIELNKTKDRLFSIIGHDLKNPLNNVIAFAELLGKKVENFEDEKLSLYQSSIYDSAILIQQLLDNLLNWARMQQNEMVFNPQQISVSTIIDETFKIHKTVLEHKSIKFTNETEEDTLVYADKEMLATIIRNLVSNAIKFTKSGGEASVSTNIKTNGVDILVKDSGIGMNEEQLKNISKSKHNISTHGTYNERGTGLGLYLCKQFIEKHKGDFSIQSEKEKGTTVLIYFPNR